MLNQSTETINRLNYDCPRSLFIFILMLMSTAGLIGSDVYLPMLPEMSHVFQQTSSMMQMTIGIYLFGLAIGQLIFGPLTDRFGRKRLLIIGMMIYLFSSFACALCCNYSLLLISRFLQALGACSGLIIGRAIVGDLFDAKEAGKVFATIFPFVGMSPAISPVIGGFLGYYFGWQATFAFVGMFAFSVGLLVYHYVPETLIKENRQSLHFTKVISGYPKLFFNKRFIAYVSAPCAAYIAYFAYIAQSPFIFDSYGFGERAIGTFYISLSLTYVAGNLTAKKCLNYFELDKTLSFGFIIFNIGSILMVFAGFTNWPLILMVAAISMLTFGNGFLIPLGTAGVISSFSKSTGYASGLLGFLQLGSAAVSTALIGAISQNAIFYMGIYICIATLLGTFLFFYLSKNKI